MRIYPNGLPWRGRARLAFWRQLTDVTRRIMLDAHVLNDVAYRMHVHVSNASARAAEELSVCADCMRAACPPDCFQEQARQRHLAWLQSQPCRARGCLAPINSAGACVVHGASA